MSSEQNDAASAIERAARGGWTLSEAATRYRHVRSESEPHIELTASAHSKTGGAGSSLVDDAQWVA